MGARPALPVDTYIDEIVGLVRRCRAVVVTAAPGAGKTTRVPPALVGDGPVLLLQPRRVAARAIARRIAEEQGWTVGREVGWHVRFERRSSPDTRLLVVTEGMLTVRLRQDPLLSDVRTVVVDEFHERSIHADLGLTLARQAWLARDDLRLVVMSATLDTARVSAFLRDCPVVEVPGRLFPVDIEYRPGATVDAALIDWLTLQASSRKPQAPSLKGPAGARGAALCFLPGAPEIRRTAEAIAARASVAGVPVLPLHGGLDADEQDAALRPSAAPRLILATNIAETTLTVPDVACVVDTGLHKVARYDAARAVDSLELERVSQDAADQRAGRAGRTQPGKVLRLWDAQRGRLRPHREPEIARVDLAGPVLDVLAWGGDPRTLEWFESPPPDALEAALQLLGRLGAIGRDGRLTGLGKDMQRLPLHPRLARLLIAAHGTPQAALACALLSERLFVPPRRHTTSCDLLAAIEDERGLPGHVRSAATEIQRIADAVLTRERAMAGRPEASAIETTFRRAVLAAYPDRVGRRRASLDDRSGRSDRLLLSSGTGARLSRDSGVHNAEFLVAVDVASVSSGGEAIVRLATGIEREWLVPTSRAVEHRMDLDEGAVRAADIERYDRIVLSEHPCSPDPDEAARLIEREYVRRGPSESDRQLLRRLAFAGAPRSFESLVRAASRVLRLDEVDIGAHVSRDVKQALERDAPALVRLPGGRAARLDYRENGVFASVKLQDVFGLRATPRIGRQQTPLTFELLAPNGRPVQVTSDLESFWARGYPEVRKALRARYPKHAWPEDPCCYTTGQ